MRWNPVSGWAPALAIALAMAWGAPPASAQQILLDKPVKAGELNLFPDLNNENLYYYVADKVRLATDASGTPQFSFLRYVENVRSGADQPEAREGEGGGIVHALVTLGVTPQQLDAARRELQRIKPGATIQGPVVFKSGRFGLVSSFADTKGNLTKQVVGLGSAPLLDGEKAAISIQLTKLGAKILWESFNTAAPDVSFHFEMDMSGFRSPKRATIEADWSKVYSHKAFGAGLASSFLAAEVKSAYDELRTTDAIKITQVGEDDKMDAVVATAYKMLQDRMFEPFGGTGTPEVASLAGASGGQPSLLDRATTRLKEAQAAVEATNTRIRGENKETQAANDKARVEQAKSAGVRSKWELADRAAAQAEADAAVAARRAELMERRAADAAKLKPAAFDSTSDEIDMTQYAQQDQAKDAKEARAAATAAATEAKRLRAEADKAQGESAVAAATAPETKALKEEASAPTFSVIATLEMKKVKQSGVFRMDLNKYMPENMTLAFSENIGDLRRLRGDASHFREVNLDDPLFKQREIVAMVDGLNAQDFGQFINFVDVQMRKRHAGGAETPDEVRIDRNNFNKEGNAFKLLYGWKDDHDRSKWMEYDIRATWSFFGGKSVVEPWRTVSSGTVPLAPPYRRRTVMLDGNAEEMQAAGVRAVTVKLFYDLAGAEQSKQVTLNVAKGQVAEKVEMLAPANAQDYAYEILWQLKGNRSLSAPRTKSISDIVYVDELPAQ